VSENELELEAVAEVQDVETEQVIAEADADLADLALDAAEVAREDHEVAEASTRPSRSRLQLQTRSKRALRSTHTVNSRPSFVVSLASGT